MDLATWSFNFTNKAAGLPDRDTWKLMFDSSIKPKNPRSGRLEYIAHTSARFQCSLCGKRWSSNKVTVVFHMCLHCHEGTVRVRRFGQKCRKCSDAQMKDPCLNQTNLDILMKNLVQKIKIRFYNEPDTHREYRHRQLSRSPHDTDHCEACVHQICTNE